MKRSQTVFKTSEAERRRSREWARAHPEQVKKRRQEWHARNPDYYKNYALKWKAEHPEETRQRHKAWKAANRDKLRRYSLKAAAKRMGLTLAEFDAIWAAQGGVCAICKECPSFERLAIDHDHKSGDVRGLLCGRCNRGLGHFDDNPERLTRAAAYLIEKPAVHVRSHINGQAQAPAPGQAA